MNEEYINEDIFDFEVKESENEEFPDVESEDRFEKLMNDL